MTKKPPTIASLARGYGMSADTLRRYRAAGVDIHDRAAVTEHQRIQRHRKNAGHQGAMDDPEQAANYERERALKMRADRRRAEVALANEMRESLPRAEVVESLMAACRALRAGLDALAGELPPLIAGMDAPTMEPKIKAAVRRLLTQWADNASAIVSGEDVQFRINPDNDKHT